MIASYSGNFIFIKTRKTGGTSVEIVLSSWCSGHDIVTPITAADELIRAHYGGRPMNFCDDPTLEARYRAAIADGDVREIDAIYHSMRQQCRFNNHAPARKVRQELPELWSRAFTFTIERHPYESVISRVYWRIAHRKDGDLTRFR